jgi:hypothetical protein
MANVLHRYGLEGVDGAPDVTITWTYEDQAAALREGWYLDHEDGAIQRDPDQAPRRRVDVFSLVRLKATHGSELHLRAMILDAWAAVGVWETRYREATKQGAADA